MRYACCWLACAALLAAAAPPASLAASPPARAGDLVLLDPAQPQGPARVEGAQCRPDRQNGALRLTTPASKGYPGVLIRPAGDKWDLSAYSHLAVAVRNAGKTDLAVFVRVDNPGADGKNFCLRDSLTLGPLQSGTVRVELKPACVPVPKTPLFGMRGYPRFDGIDTANVTGVTVFLSKPSRGHEWEILSIKATGQAPSRAGGTAASSPAVSFFPFIDTFGQYKHADWPGKTHSLDDLTRRRQEEAASLKDKPGPGDWDRWGGFQAGPQLKATGFFRVQKHLGKWWLVDPDGRLFWSHGVDCVLAQDATPIAQREEWFEDFPGKLPGLEKFTGGGYVLHGHYAGKWVKSYSFSSANLQRKYGPDWEKLAGELACLRLRSWGLNTVANWSNRRVIQMRKTPYTATVNFTSRMLEGSTGYWGKFRDVFDASFEREIDKRMAQEVGRSVGDPWCLGFFVDNEIAWGDETSLAVGALQSPPDQPAKKAFVDDLKAKYKDIAPLNQAWGTSYASWQGMLDSTAAVDVKKARADLQAFYTRTAERYFAVIKAAVRKSAPNQLYLGCRFAWTNALAAQAAAHHCDVVSYNLYRRSVADFKFPGQADVPLMIGEFHFGALDRGMFHTGLVACKDQAERARTYREYVLGCMKHPAFVGCHWFKYQDEPTTGRVLDEENYQIGLIDEADTPYAETIDAVREVGYGMYKARLGD